MTAPIISCRGVSHAYGGTVALREVDLDVSPGEVVAITGPSGSGKSTLMLVLAGIVVPDEGSVEVEGVDLRTLADGPRAALRRREIGIVFQYGSLVPELTGVENVALPLMLDGSSRAAAQEAAAQMLERLGVAGVAGAVAAKMSGGQRQRVAVARAMVTGARVILADEPTGALDSAAADLVLTELVGAAREAAAAVVLVTHDARVAAHADREIHLWDGAVDAADLPAAVEELLP